MSSVFMMIEIFLPPFFRLKMICCGPPLCINQSGRVGMRSCPYAITSRIKQPYVVYFSPLLSPLQSHYVFASVARWPL